MLWLVGNTEVTVMPVQ